MSNEYKFELSPVTEMYYSDDGMYGVYKFSTESDIPYLDKLPFDEDRGIGTITGSMQRLNLGMKYECTAIESYNKKYNKWQYESVDLKIIKPDSAEERKKFLQCILTERQVDSLLLVYPNIIDMVVNEDFIDFNKIKGVGEKSLNNIKEKILENYVLSDVITLLKPYGVTIKMIKKLMEGEKSTVLLKQKLEKNPYILTEIRGLGFKKIDKIALQITPSLRISEERTRSFIAYFLNDIGNSSGHSRISIDELTEGVKDTIGDCILLYNEIIDLETETPIQLHIKGNEVGLKKYFLREQSIYEKLKNLNKASCSYAISNDSIDEACKKFNEEKGYNLTMEQRSILSALQNNNVVLLTGKAGSGKSSSVDVVIKNLDNKKINMCALSAKAVRRMVETTGMEAKTIHRLLGFKGKEFEYNFNNPLDSDIVILDEASMVNSSLFLSLLDAIPLGCKILIVFDDGQLPPIGVGNIATDLLDSEFTHIQLNKVHRQAEDSGILSDANIIREGINPIIQFTSTAVRGNLKDMYYIFNSDQQSIFDTTIKYFMKSLNSTTIDEISICVPRKDNAINSTATFNNRIQDLLLGSEYKRVQKGDKVFKLGAKVIQKVNNYDKNVVNGEIGFITNIDNKFNFMVTFDNDKVIEYEIKEMDELELAYALTVHSMQGSQAKIVIIVIDMSSFILLSKELIYTAITRASSRCMVVASPKAFSVGIKKKASTRTTWLQTLLKTK